MNEDADSEAATWLAELRAVIEVDADQGMRQLDERIARGGWDVDPQRAVTLLRGIAALLWRTPRAALVLPRLDRLPMVSEVARWRERVQHDLVAAAAFRAAYRPILPPFVHDFVADRALDPPDRRRATADALLAELRADPVHFLDSFDTLDGRCHELAEALTVRLLDEVAPDRRELDDLSPLLAAELSARLNRVGGRWGAALVRSLGVGSIVAGLGLTVLVGPDLSLIGMSAAGAGVWGAGGVRTRFYRQGIRPELLRIIVELGITRACVRESMRRKGGRLASFAPPVATDRALRLCSMVAAAAHSVGPGEREPLESLG